MPVVREFEQQIFVLGPYIRSFVYISIQCTRVGKSSPNFLSLSECLRLFLCSVCIHMQTSSAQASRKQAGRKPEIRWGKWGCIKQRGQLGKPSKIWMYNLNYPLWLFQKTENMYVLCRTNCTWCIACGHGLLRQRVNVRTTTTTTTTTTINGAE